MIAHSWLISNQLPERRPGFGADDLDAHRDENLGYFGTREPMVLA